MRLKKIIGQCFKKGLIEIVSLLIDLSIALVGLGLIAIGFEMGLRF